MIRVQEVHQVADLPDGWQALAKHSGNHYLDLEFLRYCAATNSYRQRYYLAVRDDEVLGIAVAHDQRVSVLEMVRNAPKPKTDMVFVSPPASVSDTGFHAVEDAARDAIFWHIAETNPFTVISNVPAGITLPGWLRLNGYPICTLHLRWDSFDEYLAAQRSGYRRHCKQVLKAGRDLRIRTMSDPPRDFTDGHYRLYEQVFAKSMTKIEKLSKEYFCDGYGSIVEFSRRSDGQVLGFVQTYRHDDTYVFGFVGFDYRYNQEHSVYQNMLLWLVRDAIDSGARRLVFGQTAEDAKCRLGAVSQPVNALVRARNPMTRLALRLTGDLLGYRPPTTAFHVFKDGAC